MTIANLQPGPSQTPTNTNYEDDHTVLRQPALIINGLSDIQNPSPEVPLKRPRTDEHHFNESQITSCYSLHHDIDGGEPFEVDPDDTPFTTVTYKKNRPADIPVLFTPIEDRRSFWRVNPYAISNKIVDVIREKISSDNINKDGCLSVRVASLDAANKLLTLPSLASIDVSVMAPSSFSRNLGKT